MVNRNRMLVRSGSGATHWRGIKGLPYLPWDIRMIGPKAAQWAAGFAPPGERRSSYNTWLDHSLPWLLSTVTSSPRATSLVRNRRSSSGCRRLRIRLMRVSPPQEMTLQLLK